MSPMIFFYLSYCVEIHVFQKSPIFFLRVLDIGKFSALTTTFLAHDDELDKLSFFLSVPQ